MSLHRVLFPYTLYSQNTVRRSTNAYVDKVNMIDNSADDLLADQNDVARD